MLSERQERILAIVIDAHLDTGRPVATRVIAEREGVEWSASTVRVEPATLEEAGLLSHPHTSAGRLPTDAGYRLYFDSLVAAEGPAPRPSGKPAEPERMRNEVEEAIRETTAELSRINDLLALV